MPTEHHYPSFRRWVGKQSGPYQTANTNDCPMVRWGRTQGKTAQYPGFATVMVDGDLKFPLPSVTESVADWQLTIGTSPMTYEALTKRLDARFTKTGLRRRPAKGPTSRSGSKPYPTVLTGSFKRGGTS